jgi:hypothetical protein
MNKTVKELRVMAKEAGIKNYSKMTKEQLSIALEHVAYESIRAEEESDLIITEEVNVPMNTNQNADYIISDFDIQRYAKFIPSTVLKGRDKTANQLNLVKSLENNFKVSISTDTCKDFYDLSVKLSNVYQAILSGKVARRPHAEVEARVKAYNPVMDNSATPKQLETITKLEKELGVTITTVISSKQVADTVIKSLLAQKAKSQTLKEVAVDNAKAPSCLGNFGNPSFRTKFSAMMKRIFE